MSEIPKQHHEKKGFNGILLSISQKVLMYTLLQIKKSQHEHEHVHDVADGANNKQGTTKRR